MAVRSLDPLERLRLRIQRSETVGPIALAVLIGLLAGGMAVVFRYMIQGVQILLLGPATRLTRDLPGFLPHLPVLVAPAVGLALASYMVRRWAPEAAGHGVPEVQHAVRNQGGRIRARVTIIKAVASAITIGSGGSVGREGPIVQVGAAIGSLAGRLARLGPQQVKLLLACGAAGGIGATFNAPIAGVLFALEIVLGSFAARSFGLVVVASVSATALSHAFLGREPAFRLIQPFALASEREFLLYLVLGGVIGLLSAAYVRILYATEDAVDRLRAPATVKAVAGGLVVGALGVLSAGHVLGVGYEAVERALAGSFPLLVLVGLIAMKLVATPLTLAVGGSGGVFAPALFLGAMAGGAFGQLAGQLFPTWTAPSGAYALVGMGALFAASAHAPITAVLILFEMTDNYQIILPLMLTVGVSFLVKSRVFPDSIYSIKLRRLAGPRVTEPSTSILDMLLVADAMQHDFDTVRSDMPVVELVEMARGRRTRSWPVLDAEGHLVGIVTETDIGRSIIEGQETEAVVADVMTTSVVTLRPDSSLREAARHFGALDIQQIPVVSDDEGRVLDGVIRRREMVWVYKEITEEHERLRESSEDRTATARTGAVQLELRVGRNRRVAGRRLRDIAVPSQALVTLVRREGRVFVPHGATRVRPGDSLTVLTTTEHEGPVREWVEAHSG